VIQQVAVPATHDHGLVLLSVVISIVAAYASRDLVERLNLARGRAWGAWLLAAGVVDGVGTWSMHYTGKLALNLPMPLMLDWRMVVMSYVVGVVGSTAAVALVGRRTAISAGRAAAVGVLLGGVGISALHFVAMGAIRQPRAHLAAVSLVWPMLGVVIAVTISGIAAGLLFGRGARERPARRRWPGHAAAFLRGVANPSMHYSAMAAVTFSEVSGAGDAPHLVSIESLGVLGISVVPVMVLVVGILTSLIDRSRTQRVLLDELFEQAPQAVALMGADSRIVRVNREFTRLFGYPPDEAIGHSLDDLLASGERRGPVAHYADLVAQRTRVDIEVLAQRRDGTRLPASMVCVPVSLPSGDAEMYAIFTDITERRRAEEALRMYPQRLMEAQEAERQRMARELHDEIGQVLTSVGLILALPPRLTPEQLRARVSEAQRVLDALIGQVRDLALDLRPSMLDDLGLAAAVGWLIERYTAQTDMRIKLRHSGIERRRFNAEVEIAAYRIVQEALTNVVRHARVREAAVRMSASGDTLRVEVEDGGVGFDPGASQSRYSLGLTGMRQRASIVGGRLIIDTATGAGTRVVGEFPLDGAPPETS
jgi:PAS domain S-box-containing protein